jgi:hypothetical protein
VNTYTSSSVLLQGPQLSLILTRRPVQSQIRHINLTAPTRQAHGPKTPDFSIFAFLQFYTARAIHPAAEIHPEDHLHYQQDQDDIDMNNRKRTAGAASGGSSKKRKTDNMPKFYAVKAGFNPGVYVDYADCQRQTAGFKGAVCEYIL